MAFHHTSIARRHHGGLWGKAALIALLVMTLLGAQVLGWTASARAHGTPEETVYHALTLAIGFPDAGLAQDERLCLDLFAADDTDLATAIQSRCLAAGETSVTFDGLPHGSFRIAVPADGSILTSARYAGKVAESEIPNDPEVDAYVIDLMLSLVDAAAGTSASMEFTAFLCSPGASPSGDLEGWIAACPDRIGGLTFSVMSEGSLAAARAAGTTTDDGRTLMSGLPAGLYRVAEGPSADELRATTWFVTSSFDGVPTLVDPESPLAVRPAETLAVAVFHTVDSPAQPGEPSVAVGTPPAVPENPSVSVEPSVGNAAVATETAGGADITPFISVGPEVTSGPVASPDPGPALHPGLISTITTLPSTGARPPSHLGMLSWAIAMLTAILLGSSRGPRASNRASPPIRSVLDPLNQPVPGHSGRVG